MLAFTVDGDWILASGRAECEFDPHDATNALASIYCYRIVMYRFAMPQISDLADIHPPVNQRIAKCGITWT